MRVQTCRCSKDWLFIFASPSVRDEHRISRPRCVVSKQRPIAGPVKLGHAVQKSARLSSQGGHLPNANSACPLASPQSEKYLGTVRRKLQVTHFGISKILREAVCKVVKLAGAQLRDPDIHLAITI